MGSSLIATVGLGYGLSHYGRSTSKFVTFAKEDLRTDGYGCTKNEPKYATGFTNYGISPTVATANAKHKLDDH